MKKRIMSALVCLTIFLGTLVNVPIEANAAGGIDTDFMSKAYYPTFRDKTVDELNLTASEKGINTLFDINGSGVVKGEITYSLPGEDEHDRRTAKNSIWLYSSASGIRGSNGTAWVIYFGDKGFNMFHGDTFNATGRRPEQIVGQMYCKALNKNKEKNVSIYNWQGQLVFLTRLVSAYANNQDLQVATKQKEEKSLGSALDEYFTTDKYFNKYFKNTDPVKIANCANIDQFATAVNKLWGTGENGDQQSKLSDGWKTWFKAILDEQSQEQSQQSTDFAENIEVKNDGSYKDWENVMTLINLGYGPQDGRYDSTIYQTSKISAAEFTNAQKAHLYILPYLWTETKKRPDGDSTKEVPYDRDNTLATKETILSEFTSAGGGSFVNANDGMTNALTELDTLKTADTSFTKDRYLNMLTYYDRVKYYAYSANQGGDAGKPAESDSIKQFYLDAATGTGDDTLLSNMPSVLTNDLQFAPAESGGMFAVKDIDAYIRLYETAMEIETYARYSCKNIQKAIDDKDDTQIKNWAKALNNLKSGLDFLNCDALNAIWKDSSITEGDCKSLEEYYELLKDSVGNLEDIGKLDATLETGRPLGQFFDSDEEVASNYILQGVSYSTQYIPMRTNVYDQYTVAAYDSNFLSDFHYKYGFNRKALLIDESSDSAMQLHNTQAKGTVRVCTLRDLINCVGDITLYLDDNFYNANQLADLLGASYDKVTNTDDAEDSTEADTVSGRWWTKITENLSEAFDLDFKSQVKTGEDTQYSSALRNRVACVKDSGYIPAAKVEDSSNSSNEEDDRSDDNKDNIVMTSGQINEYLNMETVQRAEDDNYSANFVISDYNVLQGYAVVSAVYRDGGLFNLANSKSLQTPVFVASKTVPNEQNATQYERNEIFNWLLLKNLKSQMTVGYETSLDMDCPVYMDIYGNIVTESGVVVVPAASNASLYDGEYYDNIFSAALPYIYGGDYQLDIDTDGSYMDGTLSSCFEEDSKLGNWKVRSRTIDGNVVDFARLSVADTTAKETMTKAFNSYLVKNHYLYNKFVNISLEVMRGAPIEYIDKDYEGLNPTIRDKAGLLAAAKLEVLEDALNSNNENTVLSIPNLAFVDGVEYIALFAFKIMMFIVILVLMITLYTDMVGQTLTWRTFAKCLGFVGLTVLSIVTIPTVFEISYYESNRMLLQGETEYVAMLNEEKRQNGVEIGVYNLREPDIESELYVKLDDIHVPWYDLFSDIMLSSTFNGIEDIYASYADDSPIAHQPDVTVMNDGVYISLSELFDSVSIDTDTDTGVMTINTDKTTTSAFYMPYYSILEALVTDVNDFNQKYNWNGYTNHLQKGGRLKSMGVIEGYFTDVEFMEGDTDILHMEEIYNIDSSMVVNDIWDDEEVAQMSKSAWYHKMATSDQMEKRFNILSNEARTFVANNRGIIGTISDETFLKVMALDLAMEHNKIFGVSSCNAIEIKNLSLDDTMRLMTGTRAQVMYDSTLSYPRYIYEIGGTVAVYMSALLNCVNFVAGYVKPICTFLIMVIIYISLFIFKVCLHKKSSSVYGYAITTVLLCMLNIVYAIVIKLSMYLPTLAISPTICILADILIQVGYMGLLLRVVWMSLKDWQDLGFARYQYKMSKMEVGANELKSYFKQKFHFFGKGRRGPTSVATRRYDTGRPEDNWKYYDELTETRKQRKKKYHIG